MGGTVWQVSMFISIPLGYINLEVSLSLSLSLSLPFPLPSLSLPFCVFVFDVPGQHALSMGLLWRTSGLHRCLLGAVCDVYVADFTLEDV